MNTPICDFVGEYAAKETLRLHMPGHKGSGPLGTEKLDITEISGADSLYEAEGIIAQSEKNASELFGCSTFYSTEGSSQCIRGMLYLAMLKAKTCGRELHIAAGRNAHKTFLSAAALLDADVTWICAEDQASYLSCRPAAEQIDDLLKSDESITAVYITSPDYLGNLADIRGIAEVCRRRGVLLMADNAHGAYLHFLRPFMHPIDLGADLCCDSAHKTLPVLTGGAYLHVADEELAAQAKNALALFGSTSPSYLILQSLDAANAYLAQSYSEKLCGFAEKAETLRERLRMMGYQTEGEEPLKITIRTKPFGYEGNELAKILEERQIVCEFSDPDYVVLMLTPELSGDDLTKLETVLREIPGRARIEENPPAFALAERVMSIRKAMFSLGETLPVRECEGRILAAASVGCPPAVPVVMCGERIDEAAVKCFAYYGIEKCYVVKE